ncbi:MAG: sugar-binding domain-containing protein [Planctomycetota bacterium]
MKRLLTTCPLVSSLALLQAAIFVTPLVTADAADTLDLAGEWRLTVAGDVERGSEPPEAEDAVETIELPGSMQSQGYGDRVTMDAPWTPRPPEDSDFYKSDQYASFRREGQIKVPFALQPNRMFVGAAWYEREFDLPAEWKGKRVVLSLERPHWFTEVWIDGSRVGTGESLSTPHRFVLPDDLQPGKHTLQVCVDNRLHVSVGESAHSVSDYTQTNWNGVVGEIKLHATPKVWIDHVRNSSDIRRKRLMVRIKVGNETTEQAPVGVRVTATPRGGGASVKATTDAIVPSGGGSVSTIVELGPDAKLWDEFDPALYDIEVTLSTDGGEGHTRSFATGIREVGTKGTQITINGRPVFLRGTLECCVFPETGFPPTDVTAWKGLFGRCQEFGLNHVRFHSHCPPEAAFVAADEMGIYLQPEAASWAYVGNGEPIDEWIFAETRRILAEYGHHPSFVMMAYGNEPHPFKPTRDAFLSKWVTHFRSADPRRLYCCSSGWPTLRQSDFHVLPRPRLHQWGEGMRSRLNAKPPTTEPDFESFVAKHDRPVVAHEIGQWCAYPNFDERGKYTGVTRAKNFDIFEHLLDEAGMGSLAHQFYMASGELQELCYKEEVETSLRTEGLGGFQLLGLNDFPGQGTAPVGLCDAFWDVKAYASPEGFRQSCDDIVALARLPRRVFTSEGRLEASFEVANFSRDDTTETTWRWQLANHETVFASGELASDSAPTGENTDLGKIDVDLTNVDGPAELTLSIEGPSSITNSWRVWVYPSSTSESSPSVRLASAFDADARASLGRGETMLLLADPASVESDVQVGFTPIFWNTAYTNNQPPHTLGLLVDPQHRLFKSFPTRSHSDWQWWEVLHGCRAMELDTMPADLEPLVRVIPDWFKPQRLALAFEATVGPGKLLVCSAELQQRLDQRRAARAFRDALIQYAASDQFNPAVPVTADQVARLFATDD